MDTHPCGRDQFFASKGSPMARMLIVDIGDKPRLSDMAVQKSLCIPDLKT
jgi:hypothetical protein